MDDKVKAELSKDKDVVVDDIGDDPIDLADILFRRII